MRTDGVVRLEGRGLRGAKGDVGDVNPQMPILVAEAEAARDAAEDARDEAVASSATAQAAAGPTYPNTAAGLAATTSGQAFAVDNGNGTVTVYLNNAGVAVAQRMLATVAYLASASGSSAIGVATGRLLSQELQSFRTPRALGGTPGTTDGVNQNVLVGGIGTFSNAAGATRAPWDAIGPNAPTVGANSLGLTGHRIVDASNSAVIIGGRAGYYSAVGGPTSNTSVNGYGSLTVTYGGDNWNNHLAGFCLSMHSDLIQGTGADGVAQKGSHGFALGGSYGQVAGDYSGFVGGQRKKVFALQSISLGGVGHEIGTLANVDAVRRSGLLGGLNLRIDNAEESAMIGGIDNTMSGNRSVMAGGSRNSSTGAQQLVSASQDSTATADRAVVLGSIYAKADVIGAITRSTGRHSVAGDSQTHHVEARRASVGPNVFLSITGGAGTDLYTPEPNTRGIVTFEVSIQEAGVTANNGAEYVLTFGYSNIGGTLIITGQNLTTISEDNPAFDCNAIIAGTGTRLALRVVVPNTNIYRATATGRIVVNRI